MGCKCRCKAAIPHCKPGCEIKWEGIILEPNRERNKKLTEYLSQFVSESRWKKFNEIIENRTRHLTLVLEDIYQPHNASAVLRSCDCFGIQDVHIIENINTYEVNPDVALGSSKWLNLYKYNKEENNTLSCIQSLKQHGYRIVATSPHKNDCNIEELPVEQKTALVFGTELKGVTSSVMQHADAFVRIPMVGFTESFNISVSAAICLYALSNKVRSSGIDWKLTENEKGAIILNWLRNSISKSELIEKKFLEGC